MLFSILTDHSLSVNAFLRGRFAESISRGTVGPLPQLVGVPTSCQLCVSQMEHPDCSSSGCHVASIVQDGIVRATGNMSEDPAGFEVRPVNAVFQKLFFPRLPLAAISAMLLFASASAATRSTLLVPLRVEPSWHDMAFLAAIPASKVANNGFPSLIALDDQALIGPEIQDYARRYQPKKVFLIGSRPGHVLLGAHRATVIPAADAEEAGRLLSKAFWRASRLAVFCHADDYGSGLVASPLASLLRAPLLYAGRQGVSRETLAELKRLGVQEIVVVGEDVRMGARAAAKVTELRGASSVLAWVRARGMKVRYLAAVNPVDRSRTAINKLSLAGALLAAGRDGLVVPLRYDTEWKVPVPSAPLQGQLPPGVPKSEATPKAGVLRAGGREYAFVLVGGRDEQNLRLYVDRDGDGTYGGVQEGPFASGDVLLLGSKQYVVSLGTRTGFGKTDVHLTWPTAVQLSRDLRRYYRAMGSPPEYLCLIGFPDAIPQGILGHGAVVEEQTSDLSFANADDDPFAEIGVARLVAESVSFATLYVSRVLTYRDLLSSDWQNKACAAQWENTYQKLFANVGFEASTLHTQDDLEWVVPPKDGKPGVRAESFAQSSPLASCALLTHGDHSWWRGLGGTFTWDSSVLMAPTIVESSGCGTACLDREADYRSVVARLFRQGAAAFIGNSREAPTEQEPLRQEFWNGVLAGTSIGQAHKQAINSALLTVLDRGEDASGIYRYSMNIRTLFGDPAFTISVPEKPRSAPARVAVDGNTVTVYAPEQWWPIKRIVPPDWKLWAGKDLYVVRGAGCYALSDWCAEGYDLEQVFFTAEFTSHRRVQRIEQVQNPDAPLGWRGTWYVDDNPDGTYTYRWAVRVIDFDQIMGRIIRAVERLDYKVTFE